jgi:hypothetical protein
LILKLSLYLDEDTMSRTLVTALRARGVDLETVVEAELEGESDKFSWIQHPHLIGFSLSQRT